MEIRPGHAAALPVITEAATAWHGLFVRMQTADGRLSSPRPHDGTRSPRRNRLSFLHIQVDGQQGSCGPLLLETLVTTHFEVWQCQWPASSIC